MHLNRFEWRKDEIEAGKPILIELSLSYFHLSFHNIITNNASTSTTYTCKYMLKIQDYPSG